MGGAGAADLAIDSLNPGQGRFLVQPGERAIVQGDARGALEAWIYPLQIFTGYGVTIVGTGRRPMPLTALPVRTVVRPDSVERIYSGRDFTLTEHWFVPRKLPGAVLDYHLGGTRNLTLRVRFQPVLNLMWPGTIGGQETTWSRTLRAFVIREPSGRFRGYVGSPQAQGPSLLGGGGACGFTLRLTLSHPNAVVAVGLGLTGHYHGRAIYHELAQRWPDLQRRDRQELNRRMAKLTVLRTPDAAADRAFRWAEIALLQAWVCNPQLGCGLVAGYGPTRDGRRPQYDWFFGGDGLVATRALDAIGDRSRVAAEFAFLRRYQNPRNGMMWHELSQSAGLIDWGRYPYEYLHPDISMDYLVAAAGIWRTTADRRWLAAAWPSLAAAYRYIGTLREPGSGIPLIPRGERGQNEQLSLRDALSLSLDMAAAERGYAVLATAMGYTTAARDALTQSGALRRVIAGRYWNARQDFVIQGFLRNGRPTPQQRPPIAALDSAAFTPAQQSLLIDRLLQPDFLTPWGVRSLPTTDAAYDPTSYASGSVWPVANAAFAIALWRHQRDAAALRIWKALVTAGTLGTPGHIAEVFSGREFKALAVAVPAQTWSSAGFVLATVQGLLGYRPDAPDGVLSLAPHLPAGWKSMSALRLPFGDDLLSVAVQRRPSRLAVQLEFQRMRVGTRWIVTLPAACDGASLHATVDGHWVQPEVVSVDGHLEATVRGAMGRSRSATAVLSCANAS